MDSRLPFQKIEEFSLVRVIQDSPYAMAIEAYQVSLRRPVFIKLLKPQVKDQKHWVTRFTREAQVSAGLKHPHIVDVYTIGEKEGYTFMAQAWVEGLSVKELLSREKSLSSEIAFEIIRQMLQALQFAHQKNIIHRDIKPGNILIDIHGEAHLTDFGLAHLGEEISVTHPGSILGTPAYMAPEQVTGEKLTPATDLFAIGITLYEMLTGIKPFAGENYSTCIQKILNVDPSSPSTHNSGIPKQIDDIVLQLLEKDARQRPQSASQALEKLIDVRSTFSHTQITNQISLLIKKYYQPGKETNLERSKPRAVVSTNSHTSRPQKRIKWGLLTGVVAAVVILLVIILNFDFRAGSPDEPDVVHLKKDSVNSAAQMSGSDLNKEKYSDEVTAKEAIHNQTERSILNSHSSSGDKIDKVRSENLSQNLSDNKESSTTRMMEVEHQTIGEGREEKSSTQLASLEVVIKPWAILLLDGAIIDSMVSERRLSLSPGNHRLVLSHPKFAPKIFNIDVKAGENKNLSYSFYEQVGYLAIEVRPWAEIFLNGKYIETTPINHLVLMNRGEHLLELKNPYFDTYRQLLQIEAGDTLYLKHTLRK